MTNRSKTNSQSKKTWAKTVTIDISDYMLINYVIHTYTIIIYVKKYLTSNMNNKTQTTNHLVISIYPHNIWVPSIYWIRVRFLQKKIPHISNEGLCIVLLYVVPNTYRDRNMYTSGYWRFLQNHPTHSKWRAMYCNSN